MAARAAAPLRPGYAAHAAGRAPRVASRKQLPLGAARGGPARPARLAGQRALWPQVGRPGGACTARRGCCCRLATAHRRRRQQQANSRSLAARRVQVSSSKGLVELTHVSKSGGTSMCRAAEYNGCSNPSFNVEANCMLKPFHDDPKWSLGTDVQVATQEEPFHVGDGAGLARLPWRAWRWRGLHLCSGRASPAGGNAAGKPSPAPRPWCSCGPSSKPGSAPRLAPLATQQRRSCALATAALPCKSGARCCCP
jgi:hypothetical protein